MNVESLTESLLNEGVKDVIRSINPGYYLGKYLGKKIRDSYLEHVKSIDDPSHLEALKTEVANMEKAIAEHKKDAEGDLVLSADDKKDVVRWVTTQAIPLLKMKIRQLESNKK
jgi:ribosomal protein S15P/S13E